MESEATVTIRRYAEGVKNGLMSVGESPWHMLFSAVLLNTDIAIALPSSSSNGSRSQAL